jgi:D-glucuronyl C5-epimerase C-terminus/Putative peptidoglycan binding domain
MELSNPLGSGRRPEYIQEPVPHTRDAVFFTDDDFVWEEPAPESDPTLPTVVPRPRNERRTRQTRTFAGDLARLRDGVREEASALPPRAIALLGAGLLAAVVVLILALKLPVPIPGRDAPESAAPPNPARSSPKPNARPVNAPPSPKLLQAGDRTAAVADLQQALAALGLYSGGVDGVFGDSTAAAVSAFQSQHGLVADGVAGPLTVQALVETLGASARTDAATARQRIADAEAEGRLSPESAAHYREMLATSVAGLEQVPPGRVPTLALVFRDVAAIEEYNEPRALTLLSMLARNTSYLTENAPSPDRLDITDDDGVVYRFFADHGYQFHPIAEFARLNKLAARKRSDQVERLAHALVARGLPQRQALIWEYYFPFGGPANWSSGFAQAIAAQALARSAALLGDESLEEKARAAYRGIGKNLYLSLGGGVWVREYGYTDMAILNAQLQSLVSLYDYVRITGDEAARATTEKMALATKALLPQFDTGCWSRYSLGGSPASVHYHTYHVSLLKQLADVTGDSVWATTASRWQGYLQAGAC